MDAFTQPHTPPVRSALGSAGEPGSSGGRANSANHLVSPRLKNVKINNIHESSDVVNGEPVRKQGNVRGGGLDVQELLNDMDNHQNQLSAQQQRRANSPNIRSPATKLREPSPGVHRHSSPNNSLRVERDALNDRCQQLQQQVRSLQLAYKESAKRRGQEEQAFREILRIDRERFDRELSRLQSKLEDRDSLLVEWVKAIYERNAMDAKTSGNVEKIPELSEGNANMKDMRNTFSLLSARSASIVSAARQYLTTEDIEHVSRNTALNNRKRGKKKISTKKRGDGSRVKKTSDSNNRPHRNSKSNGEKDAEEEEETEDEQLSEDPLGAFRPKQQQQSASPVRRKKQDRTNGAPKNRLSAVTDDEDDDNRSTISGSIMDIDDFAHHHQQFSQQNISKATTRYRNQAASEEEDEDDGEDQISGRHRIVDDVNVDGEDAERPGSKNQSDARKEDADRLLQELIDALSLDEQLSDVELEKLVIGQGSSKASKKTSSKQLQKTTGVDNPNVDKTAKQQSATSSGSDQGKKRIIMEEASREIKDFLVLASQDKETERLLTDYLEQQKANVSPDPQQSSSQSNKSTKNSNQNLPKSSAASTTRSSMSAGTNATFSELNLTPLSTTSAAQQTAVGKGDKPGSVTGKSIEEYLRNLQSAQGTDHAGLYAGLQGVEDNQDLEQQLQEILQSVSDITKSIESSDDFAHDKNVDSLRTSAAAQQKAQSSSTSGKSTTSKPNSDSKNFESTASQLTNKNRLPGSSSGGEETENAQKLYELLQMASESIAEANAAVGNSNEPHAVDAGVALNELLEEGDVNNSPSKKKNTKKKSMKSVSIKLTPEDELRQLVQDTVKFTQEVTVGSAAQGNVASATRELDGVVKLRSSTDMSMLSKTSNLGNPKQQSSSSTGKGMLSQGVSLQQGSLVSSLGQGSSSITSQSAGLGMSTISSTALNRATQQLPPMNSAGTNAKAQQMVETYLGEGSTEAIAVMNVRPSHSSSSNVRPIGDINSKANASTGSSSKPNSGGATTGKMTGTSAASLEGSLSSGDKYWWDVTVSGSLEPPAGTAGGGQETSNARNTASRGSIGSGNSKSRRSFQDTDGLQLGGDLDHN